MLASLSPKNRNANISNSSTTLSNTQQFNVIATKWNEYTKKDILLPTSKYIENGKGLYIQLWYKLKTDLNIFESDIIFSLNLTENFPSEPPYVRCLSNFMTPTLFDNRNLLCSILKHNWSIKGISNYFVAIEEIILQIPNFLKKIHEDCHNKTLVYYGDYIIDSIYEMNDFLVNGELQFFRVNQILKQKTERYIIWTDLYFLLFHPAPETKNFGKLLFIGNIEQLGKLQFGKQKEVDTIIINWTGGEKDFTFEFIIMNSTPKDFSDEANKRIKRLKDRFDYFDTYQKINDNNETYSIDVKITKENLEEIKKLILYKEGLYEKKKTMNWINELMTLYEKWIEVWSAIGDDRFVEYLEKLKKLWSEKDTLEHIDKDMDQGETTKQMFKMSKSYADEE